MLSIAPEAVEILVRAGAASMPRDDARHRALVEAYINFEPALRQKLDVENEVKARIDDQAGSQLRDELEQSTQDERESAESWRPDEDDQGTSGSTQPQAPASMSFMDSPDMSFNSVFHNNDSPVLRGNVQDELGSLPYSSMRSQDSAVSGGVSHILIADSQPQIGSRPPTIVSSISHTHRNQALRTTNSSSNSFSNNGKGKARTPEVLSSSPYITLSLSQDIESSSPAEIPSSPSPPKRPQRRSTRILKQLENPPSSQTSTISHKRLLEGDDRDKYPEPGPVAKMARRKVSHQSTDDTTKSQYPLLKDSTEELPEEVEISPAIPHVLLPSILADLQNEDDSVSSSAASNSSELMPTFNSLPSPTSRPPQTLELPGAQSDPRSAKNSTQIATSSAGSVVPSWANTFEIRASAPKTSCLPFSEDTLITHHLQRLVNKMSHDNPFVPASQVRGLRGTERGNWLVSCKAWNSGLRARAWDMLGNFVGKDMAGWGVRCVRSEDHDWITVFCWGQVVEHIWFLLFLASEGKIKHSEAKWIGGDGKPLITMP